MDYGLIYLFFSFSIIVFSITDWLRGIRKNVLEFLGVLCFLKCQCLLCFQESSGSNGKRGVSRRSERAHCPLQGLLWACPSSSCIFCVQCWLQNLFSVNLSTSLCASYPEAWKFHISGLFFFFPPVDAIKLPVVFRASYPQNDYPLFPDREKVVLFS